MCIDIYTYLYTRTWGTESLSISPCRLAKMLIAPLPARPGRAARSASRPRSRLSDRSVALGEHSSATSVRFCAKRCQILYGNCQRCRFLNMSRTSERCIRQRKQSTLFQRHFLKIPAGGARVGVASPPPTAPLSGAAGEEREGGGSPLANAPPGAKNLLLLLLLLSLLSLLLLWLLLSLLLWLWLWLLLLL